MSSTRVSEHKFCGLQIEAYGKSGYCIHQTDYHKRIFKHQGNSVYEEYQSLRTCLAWNTLTRPDISCAVAKAAQVTEFRFSKHRNEEINNINSIARHVLQYPHFRVKFLALDKSLLRLQTYTDAAFADNNDTSSQLGYIIFLVDKYDYC